MRLKYTQIRFRWLISLSSDDNEIMNHRRMAALTLLMKHIRHRDMMELLDKLPQVMVEISDEQVRVLIHYIVNAGDSVSPEFMRGAG